MSVYRVTDLIGTSTQSWEDAASVAIRTASATIRDLRVAEVITQDIHLSEDGEITSWNEASRLVQVRINRAAP